MNARRSDYRTNSVSDEKAKNSRTNTSPSNRPRQISQLRSFAKLNKALPAKKVTRYLQSENKIRAWRTINRSNEATAPIGGSL